MMHHLVRLLVCAVLSCGVTTAWVRAQPADHPAEAELLADVSSIKPGQPFQVGIYFKMQPGWHVYWLNPGDAGEPPQVKWTLPEGFTVSELQFPVPKRFDQAGDIIGYGYEAEVLLIATVAPPKQLEVGQTVRIIGDVTWLICADLCIPGEAQLSIELSVAEQAEPAYLELFEAWHARLPMSAADAGTRVQFNKDWPAKELHLIVNWKDSVPRDVQWFPPPAENVTFSDVRVSKKSSQTHVTVTFAPLAQRPLPQETLESVLAYDAGDGTRRGLVVPFDLKSNRDDILLPTD